MQQFGAQGLGEAAQRELGAAISALDGHGAPGQHGADLDDGAGGHAFQRGERAVDGTEIGHLGHAGDLGLVHTLQGRIDGGHGVVHPDGDGAKGGHDGVRGGVHGSRVRHVRAYGVHAGAGGLKFGARGIQAGLAARDQADGVAAPGEGLCGGSADAGAATGDDDDLVHACLPALPAGGGVPDRRQFRRLEERALLPEIKRSGGRDAYRHAGHSRRSR